MILNQIACAASIPPAAAETKIPQCPLRPMAIHWLLFLSCCNSFPFGLACVMFLSLLQVLSTFALVSVQMSKNGGSWVYSRWYPSWWDGLVVCCCLLGTRSCICKSYIALISTTFWFMHSCNILHILPSGIVGMQPTRVNRISLGDDGRTVDNQPQGCVISVSFWNLPVLSCSLNTLTCCFVSAHHSCCDWPCAGCDKDMSINGARCSSLLTREFWFDVTALLTALKVNNSLLIVSSTPWIVPCNSVHSKQ